VFFSLFFFGSLVPFVVLVHKWQNSSQKIQRGNVIFLIIQSAFYYYYYY